MWSEADAIDDGKNAFGIINLRIHKYNVVCYCSKQLWLNRSSLGQGKEAMSSEGDTIVSSKKTVGITNCVHNICCVKQNCMWVHLIFGRGIMSNSAVGNDIL